MFSKEQFDWVDFYKEFAQKLLKYKVNRKELVSLVENVYKDSAINMPTLEIDNKLVDIDPFTIFGLFNKGITKDNRLKIMSNFAKRLNIQAKLPTSFGSIPVLNNQNATFYYFANLRAENDIDELWCLFESALNYAKNATAENRKILSYYFDIVINKKGNGNSKITMGLYWIAPNTFLNLDSRNEWYIYESGKLPAELVNTLPNVEPKISSQKYFTIVERLKEYLFAGKSELKDFNELSFEAWRYSEEVNQQKKQEQMIEDKKHNLEEDEKEQKYSAYTKDDFLSDVYMTTESYNSLVRLLENKKNIILQGAPGVGKTYIAKRLAYSIIGEKNIERVDMVQFHQSYSYEDFIMGFRPDSTGFELKTGVFYNFCKEAEKDEENKYFFIIDEINRGNLSKIFGELFMLIENDKRNTSIQLIYNNEKFSVPKNVYIIGMMNTADRSLAMLDYALRRRFAFFDIVPGFDTEGFKTYKDSIENPNFGNLINCVKRLNEVIANDETLGNGFCIGHSYFCNLSKNVPDKEMIDIIEFELIPLIKEYWFDEKFKVNEWIFNLRGSIK